MIGRLALAAGSLLFLIAAASPWRWALPDGVAPPPVPRDNPMSVAKVALGHRLFYDADLSIDGTMACATCHEQKHAFADGNTTHPGVHGDPGRRNVPGLANVGWLPSFTWGDPRVRTLEAQAAIPIFGTTPVEMGMRGQEAEIARRLERDPCYVRLFREAFPDRGGRIDAVTVAMALASFERTLVSRGAPADRGDLSPMARRGRAVFARDCAACHAGADFTDGRFHAIEPPHGVDRGLAEVTGRAGDAGKFRTPSLRNVAMTGPWLHDGSAATLADAIARHPGTLRPGESGEVIAYLTALTDPGFLTDPAFAYPDTVCSGAARNAPRSTAKAGVSVTVASIAASSVR